MSERFCVVMAGGTGERFWPVSRPGRPKQLLNLTHDTMNMLEEAVDRATPLFHQDHIYVATSLPLHDPIVEAKIVAPEHVLGEPAKRNTLGAQCWIVANLIARGAEDVTLAIVTSDHYIGEPDKFRACLESAMGIAEKEGGIVTLGISPTRPETGYGYIEEDLDRPIQTTSKSPAHHAKSFREKPSAETAEDFLASGGFVWNSGMFFYKLGAFLEELHKTQPRAHQITMNVADALRIGDTALAIAEFEKLPNISIDYAVMERADNVYVLRADFPWDDVGAWDAVERSRPPDAHGNVFEGRVLSEGSRNCIALGKHPAMTIGLLGLKDMVVIVSEEAVLVCHKEDVQRVRLLAQLDEKTTS